MPVCLQEPAPVNAQTEAEVQQQIDADYDMWVKKLGQQITQYADMVSRNAEWLSLPDLHFLCEFQNKAGVVAFFDEPGPPRLQCLQDILHRLCDLDPVEMPDLKSPDTWCFVACRLDFKRGGFLTLNHFIPCWHFEQLGKENWEVVRLTTLSLYQDREHQLQEMIVEAYGRMKDSNEEALEVVEAQVFSMLDEQRQMLIEKQAIEEMLESGLVPRLVPGDGNCALWSTLCLQAGPAEMVDFVKGLPEVLELRQQLKAQWLSVVDIEEWMLVFRNCELPFHVEAAAARAQKQARSETPPRRQKPQFDSEFSPEKEKDRKSKRARPAAFGQPRDKNHLMASANSKITFGEDQDEEEEAPKSRRGKRSHKDKPEVNQEEIKAADQDMVVLEHAPDDVESLMNPKRIKRQQHVRCTYPKVPTEAEIQKKAVKAYLNSLGALWRHFQKIHNRPWGLRADE